MSYPKQQGYIPEYSGPPPVDLTEPECLDHAIRQCNDEKTYFFIDNPTFEGEINAPGYAGQTPLHVASRKSDSKLARKLISSGADINIRTDYGETPLHCAVTAGSLPITDLLIESGANVKSVDNGNASISHSAVRQGFIGMLHYLIERDLFNASAKDKYGRTPLQESMQKNQMESAEIILEHFPRSARELDSEMQNAAHYSCNSLNTQITWKILELAGWDLLEQKDRGGFLPLQLADTKAAEKNRGRGNPMKPGSTPSSEFSDQFLDASWSEKEKRAGKRIQEANLLKPIKLIVSLLFISLILEHYEIRSIWAVLGMDTESITPAAFPTPSSKASSYLQSSLASYLSTLTCCCAPIISDDKSFHTSLIFFMLLHVAMAFVTKLTLTAHPNRIPANQSNEKPNPALQRIVDEQAHSSSYCHQLRIILPPKAKYCKLTSAAYYDFDHHCLFLQRTIARGNHRLFVIFIFTMVVNQIGYVYTLCVVDRLPSWTVFELLCTILCTGGAGSMILMLHLNMSTIGRGGTQYFPVMHQKWSFRNLVYFFKENQVKQQEGAYVI
ncbi:unnamed protein product [Oikopleura dioica]|uniref:Palmitoyltransferase n=2 Tax=Oikopleura dioica TaxID=34765 RepID=E4YYS2_OIKDI|nr:unnamed protein product [Oikopleura dioica]